MITVNTSTPTELLSLIRKEIKDEKIQTWKEDIHNGILYFTHSPEQWYRKAWLKPTELIRENQLRFNLVMPQNTLLNKAVSGVYHGRFIEMLCNHFPAHFSTIDCNLP